MTDRSAPAANAQDAHPQRLTPAAFAAEFDVAWPTLWCVAAAVLGDRAGADDVLQEAAIVALAKLDQFDPNSNFMAWMGRIVRFIALNHARRQAKHRSFAGSQPGDPQSLASIAAAPQSFPNPLINGRGQLLSGYDTFDDQVLHALRSLDETARACLLLRTLLDMPYRDISRALDIAEGTAMSHVHRARAALRKQLSPQPSPQAPGNAAHSATQTDAESERDPP
ncbi:MAG: sigma-70 family RNA polymerase sigma factor [Phycisphaerales bacterium]|nr:sigma-70 family RNA polymerase sigma factor [Phycisphaerales bacterium]MCI0675158.1 sigma-70 family RNA polymerase sigma factor [Phycisphaerales bacterium]